MTQQRRPWLAALLSLLGSPGLGQLYNGTALKAILYLAGLPVVALVLLWAITRLPWPPLNVVLPFGTLVGVQVWSSVDAARDARRLGAETRPWYSRWFALIPVWALNVFLLVPAFISFMRTTFIQAFQIHTGGMADTILIGDRLLADKAAYGIRLPVGATVLGRREPRRDDVAIFLFPEDRERVFVKRVIGLPGETIEIRDRTVHVNGTPLVEPYVTFLTDPEDDPRSGWGPATVPTGHVFVLGDNRDNSRDSRFWGSVPVDDVLGIAKVVYFSWDDRAGRVRWERIGKRLR